MIDKKRDSFPTNTPETKEEISNPKLSEKKLFEIYDSVKKIESVLEQLDITPIEEAEELSSQLTKKINISSNNQLKDISHKTNLLTIELGELKREVFDRLLKTVHNLENIENATSQKLEKIKEEKAQKKDNVEKIILRSCKTYQDIYQKIYPDINITCEQEDEEVKKLTTQTSKLSAIIIKTLNRLVSRRYNPQDTPKEIKIILKKIKANHNQDTGYLLLSIGNTECLYDKNIINCFNVIENQEKKAELANILEAISPYNGELLVAQSKSGQNRYDFLLPLENFQN